MRKYKAFVKVNGVMSYRLRYFKFYFVEAVIPSVSLFGSTFSIKDKNKQKTPYLKGSAAHSFFDHFLDLASDENFSHRISEAQGVTF